MSHPPSGRQSTRTVGLAVLAVTILLAACSGADNDEAESVSDTTAPDATDADTDTGQSDKPAAPDPGTVVLVDAGAEPRVHLGFEGEHRRQLVFTTSRHNIGSVGDEPVDVHESGEFELDVHLIAGSGGATARISPSIRSMDAATLAPVDDQLGPLEWELDQHGHIIDVVGPDLRGTPVVAAASLLSMPDLVAIVPSEAVGVGATWQFVLGSAGVFTAELVHVDDTTFALEVTLDHRDDNATITMVTAGEYDRATLIARAVSATASAEVHSQTTHSGEVVDIATTFTIERQYSVEASP